MKKSGARENTREDHTIFVRGGFGDDKKRMTLAT